MGFLIAAYVIVWVALFAYVLWLTGKSRKLAEDVELLKGAMKGRRDE